MLLVVAIVGVMVLARRMSRLELTTIGRPASEEVAAMTAWLPATSWRLRA